MKYKVYILTCKPTGLQYIGCTSTSLKRRLASHWGSRFRTTLRAEAFKEYGREAFTISLLKEFSSKIEAEEYESEQVKERKTYHPFGLNSTKSGQAKEVTELLKERITGEGNSFFGKRHTLDSIQKMKNALEGKRVGEKNPFFGKRHTLHTLKKMKGAKTGESNPRSKLIEWDVKFIKCWLSKGYSTAEIATNFKISHSTVCNIKAGRIWSHVV